MAIIRRSTSIFAFITFRLLIPIHLYSRIFLMVEQAKVHRIADTFPYLTLFPLPSSPCFWLSGLACSSDKEKWWFRDMMQAAVAGSSKAGCSENTYSLLLETPAGPLVPRPRNHFSHCDVEIVRSETESPFLYLAQILITMKYKSAKITANEWCFGLRFI
jgi:hypothetical protein